MQTLRASKLGLDPTLLSPAILDVLDTLGQAGFDAYIVGGGVRDLMLGLRPKDFDAVTNATPAQIREVFGKRCRIIGRRFELAHVYSGSDMIEVATFRAPPRKPATNAAGMITRDNAWGNIEQDFSRRDFTINALYYHPRKDQVLDFCHSVADIRAEKLKFLGDPLLRIEEDPVRMLRVLRFAAKLGFSLDGSILAQLNPTQARLLRDISPHRLYDESQKMFSGGYLAPLLPLLIRHHVWPVLFADASTKISPFIQLAAQNSDARIREGKSINAAFFYAVLLWQPMLERRAQLQASGLSVHDASLQAGVDVLRRQQKYTAIPRYAEVFIREVWELQHRLIAPKARQIPALALHPRFRAGFDFLYLREQSGDPLTGGMGQWWHDYQALDNDARERAIKSFNRQQLRQRKPLPDDSAVDASPEVDALPEDDLSVDSTPSVEMIAPLLPPEDLKSPRARGRVRAKTARQSGVVHRDAEHGAIEQVLHAHDQPESGSRPARDRAPQRRKRRPRDLSTVFMGPYET